MTDKENLSISKLRKSVKVGAEVWQKSVPADDQEDVKKEFLRKFTVDIAKHPEYLIQLLENAEKEKKIQVRLKIFCIWPMFSMFFQNHLSIFLSFCCVKTGIMDMSGLQKCLNC